MVTRGTVIATGAFPWLKQRRRPCKKWPRVAKAGGKKACSVAGCKRPYRAKSYCFFHYKKWRQGELPHTRYRTCSKAECRVKTSSRPACARSTTPRPTRRPKRAGLAVLCAGGLAAGAPSPGCEWRPCGAPRATSPAPGA